MRTLLIFGLTAFLLSACSESNSDGDDISIPDQELVQIQEQTDTAEVIENPIDSAELDGSYRLTLSTIESGQIISSTGGYDCSSSNCDFSLAPGDLAETFTALPDDGFVFLGWRTEWLAGSGKHCLDTGPCTVEMSSDDIIKVSAIFIDPTKIPQVSGTYSIEYADMSCYNEGESASDATPIDVMPVRPIRNDRVIVSQDLNRITVDFDWESSVDPLLESLAVWSVTTRLDVIDGRVSESGAFESQTVTTGPYYGGEPGISNIRELIQAYGYSVVFTETGWSGSFQYVTHTKGVLIPDDYSPMVICNSEFSGVKET